DELPSHKAKSFGKPHISGKGRGHTLNLHQFARDGVTLLGHLQGVDNGKIILAPDLKENLAKADKFEADFIKAVDEYVNKMKVEVPEEKLPILRDGFDLEEVTELHLNSAAITHVICPTTYQF